MNGLSVFRTSGIVRSCSDRSGPAFPLNAKQYGQRTGQRNLHCATNIDRFGRTLSTNGHFIVYVLAAAATTKDSRVPRFDHSGLHSLRGLRLDETRAMSTILAFTELD